jgi:uncharacterized protein RhaS with RHS repeats
LGGVNTYAYAANPIEWVDPLGLAASKKSGDSSSCKKCKCSIIIGETQDRVKIGAGFLGAKEITSEWPRNLIFQRPLTPAQEEISMEFNRKWINKKMDEGCTIFDLGIDPTRDLDGRGRSPYYAMEKAEIAKRRYPVMKARIK